MVARNTYVKTSAGWEQIATTIQAVPQGLVPIVPTSVVNGSTTGDGQITYSAASTVSINGVFSAAYDNYQIVFELDTGSVANGANMRLRAAGTDQSTGTNYDANIMFGGNGSATVSNTQTLGATSWGLGVTATRTRRYATMIISKPFLADYTVGLVQSTQWDATTGNNFIALSSNSHRLQTSYDGFSILASTGTMTGSMRVYGYSKGSLTQPQTIQPYSQAAGTVAASATNGSTTSPLFWDAGVTVTFPVGRFTVAPVVTASARLATAVVWSSVDSVSSTSFTVRAVRVGSYPGSGTTHSWQATQMTSSTAGG